MCELEVHHVVIDNMYIRDEHHILLSPRSSSGKTSALESSRAGVSRKKSRVLIRLSSNSSVDDVAAPLLCPTPSFLVDCARE